MTETDLKELIIKWRNRADELYKESQKASLHMAAALEFESEADGYSQCADDLAVAMGLADA